MEGCCKGNADEIVTGMNLGENNRYSGAGMGDGQIEIMSDNYQRKPQQENVLLNSSQRDSKKYNSRSSKSGKNVPAGPQFEDVKNMRLSDGSEYSGQVLYGTEIRSGFGTQIFPDGARYVGEWVDNKVQGKGTFYHTNGDTFDGTFIADKANGHGTYTHSNGQSYEGEWKDDLQEGEGKEVLPDGGYYIGQFQ